MRRSSGGLHPTAVTCTPSSQVVHPTAVTCTPSSQVVHPTAVTCTPSSQVFAKSASEGVAISGWVAATRNGRAGARSGEVVTLQSARIGDLKAGAQNGSAHGKAIAARELTKPPLARFASEETAIINIELHFARRTKKQKRIAWMDEHEHDHIYTCTPKHTRARARDLPSFLLDG